METSVKRLGHNLKRIRTEKDISQGEIARALKVHKSYVSNVENGKGNPTLKTITKLAKVLGVSTPDLLK